MVIDLANRYNCAIYSLDPRGLAPFEFDLSTAGQAAVSLTKNTADARQDDGHAARPRGRNRRARHREQQRSRSRAAGRSCATRAPTTCSGYTSAVTDGRQVPQDQRAREAARAAGALAPRLCRDERDRSGACTRRRRKRDRLRPSPRRWARSPSPAQQRRNPIRSWIGMSPGTDGKTKISFVWNPTPAVPGVRREAAATRVAARGRRELRPVPSRKSHWRPDGSSSKCRQDPSSSRSLSRTRRATSSIAKCERSSCRASAWD